MSNIDLSTVGSNPDCPKGLMISAYSFVDKWLPRIKLSRGSGSNPKDYWHVGRVMFGYERPADCPKGLDWWYWTGEKWDWHTPKQYKTPQEAYDDVKDKI